MVYIFANISTVWKTLYIIRYQLWIFYKFYQISENSLPCHMEVKIIEMTVPFILLKCKILTNFSTSPSIFLTLSIVFEGLCNLHAIFLF